MTFLKYIFNHTKPCLHNVKELASDHRVKRTLQRQKKEVGPAVFPLPLSPWVGLSRGLLVCVPGAGIRGPHMEALRREPRLEDEPQSGLLAGGVPNSQLHLFLLLHDVYA